MAAVANRVRIDRPKAKLFARQLATQHVAKTVRRIEELAKREAPVRRPNENDRPGGRLRASIGYKIDPGPIVHARVGSRVKYAEPAHQGAQWHYIRARRKKFLAFKWNAAPPEIVVKSGKWKGFVFLKSVKHPGMKGKPYLTGPLLVVGRQMGFRVVTVPLVR